MEQNPALKNKKNLYSKLSEERKAAYRKISVTDSSCHVLSTIKGFGVQFPNIKMYQSLNCSSINICAFGFVCVDDKVILELKEACWRLSACFRVFLTIFTNRLRLFPGLKNCRIVAVFSTEQSTS